VRAEWRSDEGAGHEVARRASQLELVIPHGAQSRVWAGLERRRGRLSLRLALPLFLAGAATAALLLLMLQPRGPEPAVVLLSDGTQRLVRAGEPLPRSPRLALVDLHAAGRAVAGVDTRARLDRFDANDVALSIDAGSLLLHVNPRQSAAPFVVRTPGFTARVVGTVLRVTVDAAGRSAIAVGHGAVEVRPTDGAPLMVRAGERWPADAPQAPSAAELALLGLADLEGTDAASFGVSETPKPAATHTFADETRAESALYQDGWQKLQAGDRRGALGLWREQRRRFPRGLLYSEAHASIIDALVALHADGEARAEVDAYLRQNPYGLRTPEMHFVRGTLYYAADHNCRRAAAELDLALARPAEPWAHRARAARAACHHR
jgi:Outer membrane lipoprotein/FecR protein